MNIYTTAYLADSNYTNTTGNPENITTPKSVRQPYLIPWDNPYNIIGYEMRKDIIFVMECIIFPIVTVFGCTGNIMSFIILLTKKLRNSTGVILVGLTIADFSYLVTNFVRKSACIISRIDAVYEVKYSATIFAPFFFMITSFGRVSAWLVVLISIERLIAVTFPMRIKEWVSKGRMIIAVCLIYVLTFFLLSPIAAQYERGTYLNPMTNATIYRIQNTEFFDKNKDLIAVHNEIIGTIIFRHIPVILTMLFNLIIIIALQRSKAWRKGKSSIKEDKSQAKITKMLLIVSGICLICTTPGSLILITYRLVPGFELFGIYHNTFLVMSDVSTLLTMINCSVNFIIYMVFNKQFSKKYRQIFCKFGVIQRGLSRRSTRSGGSSQTRYTETTKGGLSERDIPLESIDDRRGDTEEPTQPEDQTANGQEVTDGCVNNQHDLQE